MLLGLNTATLGLDDVFQAIAWIRGSGFEAIELSCDPGPNERGKVSAPQADENLIRHLREACSGFQLVSLHGPWMSFPGFSLLSADESLRSKSIEEVKACIDLAARLGSPQVIYHSGNPGRDATDEQALALARLSFAELDEHGGRRGVKLGLEVVDFFQPAERFEGFEAMPLSNTGITLDVGHISFPNPLHPGKPSYHPYDRIGAFIERFAPRLLSLHIHDYDGKHDHQPLGTGRIDFEDILGSLREIRYNGLLCFEFSTSVKRADILRSRELLLKKMR